MNKTLGRSLAGVAGLALAAGAVYLFDPKKGKHRRAEIGGHCKSAARRVSDGTHHLGEEISSRYHGASTRVSSWFSSKRRADAALARKVRAGLWLALKNASGVGVIAHEGTVILHGEIPAHQHSQVLEVVSSTEGVVGVADHLTDADSAPDNTPAVPIRERFNRVRDTLMQEHWSPAARVSSATMGLGLLRWAATHRNFVGGVGALTGAVLLVRSATNTPFNRLLRRGERAIEETVEEVPGVTPVVEKIKRASDELGSEWRQSTAAVN